MPEVSLTIALAAVFAAVAMLVGSITYYTLERATLSPVRRRLEASVRPRSAADTPSALTGFGDEPSPMVKRLTEFVPRSPKTLGALRRRMAIAGYHKASHVAVYSIAQIALTALGLLVPLLIMGFSGGLIYGAMGAIVGYLIPGFYVDYLIKQRQKAIQNGLPDALDLLIVCLEAGLAIDQALLRCSEELTIAHPALAEELRLINVECRAGKPRLEAFKNFASRTKVDDVRSLVAMLVQTDRFGTSIAQALRTHAEVSRTKRRQRAEESAAKMGVKLVFPLVFCLFPAFYVVTLGPAVIKFVHAFGSGGFVTGGP
jgi:tight adherence protein C